MVYRLWEEAATAEPAALRSARNPGGGPFGAAARLRDLGRRRSARACAGSIRRRPRRSTRRASACSALGALDEAGRPTAHGRAIAALPLPPRLAHMLIEAGARGWGATAAEVAVLLVRARARRPRRRSRAAPAAAGAARRASAPRPRVGWRRSWLRLLGAGRRGGRGHRSAPASPWPFRTACRSAATHPAPTGSAPAGAASGSIRPRRWRARPGSRWPRSAASPPARASSPPRRSRRRRSKPVRRPDRERHRGRVRSGHRHASAPRTAAGSARSSFRGGQDSRAEPAAIEAALLEGVRAHGLDLLPWSDAARSLRRRAAFARACDAVDPRSVRRGLARRARRMAAGAARRQAPARRGRSGASGSTRLLGWERPQGGRPARASAFRDAGGEPPRDRL